MAGETLITVKKTLGPTVGGKKILLGFTTEDKRVILNNIRKDWEKLIDLHFEYEGGISDGRVYPWKPLTAKHATYKELHGYPENILELSHPSLASRYKRGIRSNPNQFTIRMPYPDLIHGKRKGIPVTAEIHQIGASNGIPKRRIILKDFKASVNKNIINHINNE